MSVVPIVRGNSVVSVKGQTVIPKEVREALGIEPGSKLTWYVKGEHISVFVIPDDPVTAVMGILEGTGFTFDDFLRDRNEERKRERLRDEKEIKDWRDTSSTHQP